MNLKSYLRGIGIGILVTCAVFIISGAGDKKSEMSDDMIKARAKELGMVEAASTLADVGNNTVTPEVEGVATVAPSIEVIENTPEVTEAVEPTKEAEPTVEAVPTPEPTEEVLPTPTPTPTPEPEPTKEAKPTEEAKPTPTKEAEPTKETTKPASGNISIMVNSGDGSDTVSRKLKDAGVIDDAAAFDKFLISKGYDRKITTGEHKVSADATDDEIAENLIRSTK